MGRWCVRREDSGWGGISREQGSRVIESDDEVR